MDRPVVSGGNGSGGGVKCIFSPVAGAGAVKYVPPPFSGPHISPQSIFAIVMD